MTAIPERCVDGAPALSQAEIAGMAAAIDGGWSVHGTERIERRLEVQDFEAALRVVNAVGAVAEAENHHPDLAITGYRNVTVTLSTHDANGLSANDFVLARRVDEIARGE